MISFLSILAVGFFLGTRRATHPDHVIAVTTIYHCRPRRLPEDHSEHSEWRYGALAREHVVPSAKRSSLPAIRLIRFQQAHLRSNSTPLWSFFRIEV